jgi:four helix bundle protein
VDQQELKTRTKKFGLDVIRFISTLPKTEVSFVLRRQLLRSATSVGANYRAACRSRSKAEFIAKLGIAIEEADESIYWLELLIDSQLVTTEKALPLLNEANQLVAILTASSKTALRNNNSKGASSQIRNRQSAIRNRIDQVK